MPTIKFIDLEGVEHVVEAENGQSVLQAGLTALVPGLVSECGGNGACASCHCHVAQEWVMRLPEPQQLEADMLTCVANQQPNSRLTCQIRVNSELDGLVVQVTENQY